MGFFDSGEFDKELVRAVARQQNKMMLLAAFAVLAFLGTVIAIAVMVLL